MQCTAAESSKLKRKHKQANSQSPVKSQATQHQTTFLTYFVPCPSFERHLESEARTAGPCIHLEIKFLIKIPKQFYTKTLSVTFKILKL